MTCFKTLIALALSVGCLCACDVAVASGLPTLDQAHHAYYEGRFESSLRMYEQLAAAGNAEAAERAGFMLFQGGAHYGAQVPRDTARAAALLVQAARAGRPGASFMLNLIDLSN